MARWMNRMPAGPPSWRDVHVDTGAHWGYASKCISGRREQAMKDLTVTLENRPGSLADLGAAPGSAGINIEGVCGSTEGGQAAIHILVDDAADTRAALTEAGTRAVCTASARVRRGMLSGGQRYGQRGEWHRCPARRARRSCGHATGRRCRIAWRLSHKCPEMRTASERSEAGR
jgi:hypothetical protein